MVAERCTDSCTASHKTGFAYMGCNTWEVDSPARLAVRRPGVVQVPLVVAVAAVAVAVAAAVVAVAVAAGAQANLSHRRAAHCVHQTRQSAVGHMSHKSSKTRATDSPHALCRAE
jgi:hypothetical protein